MSLDDIVKDARSAKGPPGGKGGKGGGGGGKAKNDKKGGTESSTIRRRSQEGEDRAAAEEGEGVRPPADPSPPVFVGGLPFGQKAEIEAHLCAVAPCTIDIKMRERKWRRRIAPRRLWNCDV